MRDIAAYKWTVTEAAAKTKLSKARIYQCILAYGLGIRRGGKFLLLSDADIVIIKQHRGEQGAYRRKARK